MVPGFRVFTATLVVPFHVPGTRAHTHTRWHQNSGNTSLYSIHVISKSTLTTLVLILKI